jgi:hypothetical protein
MNYLLEKEFDTYFSTPKLSLQVPETFLPKDSINLTFNYPVSINELENNVTLE